MTAPPPRERLAVFARAPRLGRVKTRLCPPLTATQALRLHRALAEDTLERLAEVSRPGLEHWLFLSEALDDPRDLQVPAVWQVELQQGDTLGARLARAFREAFDAGRERLVILGSDSPTVPLEYVHQALDHLAQHEAVLGPAEDGGYYLVGCSTFVPELFADISWGSDQVLKESTEALAQAKRRFRLLPTWYDIDSEKDLTRLRGELERWKGKDAGLFPRRTSAVLAD